MLAVLLLGYGEPMKIHVIEISFETSTEEIIQVQGDDFEWDETKDYDSCLVDGLLCKVPGRIVGVEPKIISK